MIIVKLMGGLGNQMFQYALGKHLAIKNNSKLQLDINFLKQKGDPEAGKFTNRDFLLKNYNITGKIATAKTKGIKNNKNKIWSLFHKEYIIYSEPYYSFNDDVFKIRGNVYLEGYWQSERYFADIKHVIIPEFTPKAILKNGNELIAKKIIDCNSVSLHIRRGDYVKNPVFAKVLGACSIEYYKTAVSFIKLNIKSPYFFIFSDDIEWARQNLDSIDNSEKLFVDINSETTCFEDLRLMSFCKHNIIANSSFSWWGAWLNKNPGKIVIAPAKWYNDPSVINNDLIPDTWVRL